MQHKKITKHNRGQLMIQFYTNPVTKHIYIQIQYSPNGLTIHPSIPPSIKLHPSIYIHPSPSLSIHLHPSIHLNSLVIVNPMIVERLSAPEINIDTEY